MQRRTDQLIYLIIFLLAGVSCENKNTIIENIDILTLPSQTGRDLITTFTDSGKLQLVLSSPLMERYTNTDAPYTEFREGITVLFHDGHIDPVGSVTSRYAKYTDDKNLWELQDSVVAINEAGEKLETELLFWDQKRDLIYTDRFVKITTEDQIIQGYGLESDPRLSKRKIKNLSATIYISEEE